MHLRVLGLWPRYTSVPCLSLLVLLLLLPPSTIYQDRDSSTRHRPFRRTEGLGVLQQQTLPRMPSRYGRLPPPTVIGHRRARGSFASRVHSPLCCRVWRNNSSFSASHTICPPGDDSRLKQVRAHGVDLRLEPVCQRQAQRWAAYTERAILRG